ncbi:hypothetical protein [Paenibacillus sp. 23TSA30-6]|uniref:hypothetical protein n=1 Tax=Paenibacillus sp. 23TSA30-6 TaxID=2546104 RepID=UPI00178835DE|nr:hypothetical protein [Paenibacillus sp. 23TSA30-6]MBE0339588.1 hypothetical protein [Paenibacillus sp. 23TSA30-6]
MEMTTMINKKINELINLLLTDGVQPYDLIDNIFLHEYDEISYKKQNGMIIGELTFLENIASRTLKIKLRYHYTLDKTLVKIEEVMCGEAKLLWDRSSTETKILDELVGLLIEVYNESQMSNFISTLPDNLKSKIENKLYNLTA